MDTFVRDNYTNILDIMRNMAKTMATMRLQIDMLLKEIESGNKPNRATMVNARKAMLGYGMYRSMQEAVDDIAERNKRNLN